MDEKIPKQAMGDDAPKETPFAVICQRGCGRTFLSEEEYDAQMLDADASWKCQCGSTASFDDEWYEDRIDEYWESKDNG